MTQRDYQKAVCLFEPDPSVRERVAAAVKQADARPRRVRPLRPALIAAALCLALVGTAFAASPALRGMLAEALGGFAPFAQQQEDRAYVIDGIEFKVKSVLADDFTVRAYVEARDLEGGRFNADMVAGGLVTIPQKGMDSSTFHAAVLDYDEETETILLAVSTWGQVAAGDLTGAKVRIFSLGMIAENLLDDEEGLCVPVEVKPIPSLSLGADTALVSGLGGEESRLSSLGLSVLFQDDMFRYDMRWRDFAGKDVRAKLADGTLVDAPWEGGQGNFGVGTEHQRKLLVWNFTQPVDAEQIEGIYVGEDYFPIQ